MDGLSLEKIVTDKPSKARTTGQLLEVSGTIRIASDLCHQSWFVHADTRNCEVFNLFDADTSLLCMPVVQDEQIVGVINRDSFMRGMAKRFQWELYSKKRCTKMMDDALVAVEADTPIRELANLYSGSRISDTGLSCGLSWETKSDERSEETKSA